MTLTAVTIDVAVDLVEFDTRLSTDPVSEVTANDAVLEQSLLSRRERDPDDVRRL